MAGAGGGGVKILLAKPGARPEGAPAAASGSKLMRDEDNSARARIPHGSLNLLTDYWDFSFEKLLPLMTDNSDFIVVGVLGLPGVGKSTILNELYGFDGTSPGVIQPFPVLSEETKAQAKHCTSGIELRVSAERFILLDTQPIYSSSVLVDMTRPDGSSAIPVLGGDTLYAELAHELMGIQLGVFLSSVCHALLLVTEGLHDTTLWRLMQTVEMLKQGIPDPSKVASTASYQQQYQSSSDDNDTPEFSADIVFVHTKLREGEQSLNSIECFKAMLDEYFKSSGFRKNGVISYVPPQFPAAVGSVQKKSPGVNFSVLPNRQDDEQTKKQCESYSSVVKQLRNQILAMPRRSFAKPLNEREWLRNTARVWDIVKKSPVISDYSQMLQTSGLFRR